MTKKAQPPPAASPAFPEQSAGNFGAWLRDVKGAQQGTREGNDVPCGTCIACCRASMFIHLRPDDIEALARIPKPLLFPAPGAPKGHLLLGFNERGECPMLHQGRCSIYQHRPRTCRDFDCRVLAATGVMPKDDGPQGEIARRARSWRFDFAAEADRAQYSAVQAAGAFLREQHAAFPPESLPRMPVQLAILAVEVYEIFAARGLGPGIAAGAKRDIGEIARQVLAVMASRNAGKASRPRRAAPKRP